MNESMMRERLQSYKRTMTKFFMTLSHVPYRPNK